MPQEPQTTCRTASQDTGILGECTHELRVSHQTLKCTHWLSGQLQPPAELSPSLPFPNIPCGQLRLCLPAASASKALIFSTPRSRARVPSLGDHNTHQSWVTCGLRQTELRVASPEDTPGPDRPSSTSSERARTLSVWDEPGEGGGAR